MGSVITSYSIHYTKLYDNALHEMLGEYALAMSFDDLKFVQNYFCGDEHRDPTLAELRVIDTYWSDHCRHTTFLTRLENISFDETASLTKAIYEEYLTARKAVYGDREKDICLMDIATLYAKEAKRKGLMADFRNNFV